MVRFAKFIFLFIGIALLFVVILETDLDELWIEVSRVGIMGMVAIMLVYILYFGADALSWQVTLPSVGSDHRWVGRLFVVRMIGEAYNNITPTASMGGEPIKAWLLKVNWGVPLRDSGASLVIAKTTSMFSLVVFVAIGVFMLFQHPEFNSGHKLVAAGGLSFLVFAVIVFFLMQRWKLSTYAGRKLGQTAVGKKLAGIIRAAEDIDAQFASFYGQHGRRLCWSSVFAMANWMLGVVEVYLIMAFIGYPVTFADDRMHGSTRADDHVFHPGGSRYARRRISDWRWRVDGRTVRRRCHGVGTAISRSIMDWSEFVRGVVLCGDSATYSARMIKKGFLLHRVDLSTQ